MNSVENKCVSEKTLVSLLCMKCWSKRQSDNASREAPNNNRHMGVSFGTSKHKTLHASAPERGIPYKCPSWDKDEWVPMGHPVNKSEKPRQKTQ